MYQCSHSNYCTNGVVLNCIKRISRSRIIYFKIEEILHVICEKLESWKFSQPGWRNYFSQCRIFANKTSIVWHLIPYHPELHRWACYPVRLWRSKPIISTLTWIRIEMKYFKLACYQCLEDLYFFKSGPQRFTGFAANQLIDQDTIAWMCARL